MAVSINVSYYVEEYTDKDHPFELGVFRPIDGKAFGRYDIEELAETAADKYYSDCGGWEDRWPLTFVILDESGNEIGRAVVEREACLVFHAVFHAKIKEERGYADAEDR